MEQENILRMVSIFNGRGAIIDFATPCDTILS